MRHSTRWALISSIAVGACALVIVGLAMDALAMLDVVHVAGLTHILIADGAGVVAMLGWAWHLDQIHKRIDAEAARFIEAQRERATLQ